MIARLKNAPAGLFDGDDEFDRAMRQYFRQKERREFKQRLSILVVLLAMSLLINGTQLWLYVESLKICGVRP